MGVSQAGVECGTQELGRGLETGKGVVIAVKERQPFIGKVVKIRLAATGLALGDKHLDIFKPHVYRVMGNGIPAPGGVFEEHHVHAPLLELTIAPCVGGRNNDEVVVGLQLVQGIEQLRQQAGIDTDLRAHGIGRKMGRPHSDFLDSPDWRLKKRTKG